MLFVVPTPIGNLEDITLRALRTLKEVDYIVAEDTRHTGILLKHFGIEKPLISFHSHSAEGHVEKIMALLREGKKVALVSDAGMPGISDPGWLIISKAIKEALPLTVLPGASAAITAAVASGLPAHRFMYLGFLPLKKGRQTFLRALANIQTTIVIYEAPHRILKTLSDLQTFLGPLRSAAACRELTKIHEEVVRGSIADLHEYFIKNKPRGEFTLVIGENSV